MRAALFYAPQNLFDASVETAASKVQLPDYASIRAYNGNQKAITLTEKYIGGVFMRDDADTTSADDGGTIIVSASGVRWKRHFIGAISVAWFGTFDPTGTVESTSAYSAAMLYLDARGGGEAIIPLGTNLIKDLVIDRPNIRFIGATAGLSYNQDGSGVIIKPAPGAVFSVRLKGTRTGVPINASEGSGFVNVQFNDTAYTAQYNVFIDSGLTVMESVTCLGSDYNVVIADQANANIFRKFSARKGRYTNFAVTEWQAASYLHPNVANISSISNTTIHMEDVNIRQGLGMGVVLRSLVGASGSNVTIESNAMSGLYIFRPDNASIRNIGFEHWWCENNYQGYIVGNEVYSITNNRMLWTAANTPIPWVAADQVGYQTVIDAQTRNGGGCDSLDFYKCAFNNAGTKQKSVRVLAGFKINFYKPWLTGGDTANRCKVDSTAEGVTWHDPIPDNNPSAVETSLTANNGANLGTYGAYFKSGTSLSGDEFGGMYAVGGVLGGPLHIKPIAANDPRRQNPYVIDEYVERKETEFTPVYRVGSAIPFTINSQIATATKVGREVTIKGVAQVTVNAAVGSPDKFYLTGLPFAAERANFLVGECFVIPTGSNNTVLNNGVSPLYMDTTATLFGCLNNFPALAIGDKFQIQFRATYATVT